MGRRFWVCAFLAGSFCQQATAVALLADTAQEALLEVTVNGEKQPAWVVVRLNTDGAPWVRRADLTGWGVQMLDETATGASTTDTLVDLNALPGVHGSVDHASSQLVVEVQPALLHRHEFHTDRVATPPSSSPPAVFVNYDVGGQRQTVADELRANTEVGFAYGNWVARTSWLDSWDAGRVANLRLDSTLTADFPAGRTTLQWGDTFARLGTNAEAVRVAGASWGTNFSITPTFITVPLPSISSVTANSSTVDVYVNGAKMQQLNVPGGPFTVTGVPVTTGAGELTLVTHDLEGHSQTFTQSYYVPPQMLEQGLSAWDGEVGTKRLDYGAQSNDYQGWLAAVGQRYGVSDRLTTQWRFESDDTGPAFSAQALVLSPFDGLVSLGSSCAAVSGHRGCLLGGGYDRESALIGYGAALQYATADYVPVAAALRAEVPRWQQSFHLQGRGVFGISLLLGETWAQAANGTHPINLNLTLGKTFKGGGHLDLLVNRGMGSGGSSYVSLIYTHSLDGARSVSATAYSANGEAGTQAALQRNLPAGNGFGYLLRAGQEAGEGAEAAAGGEWNGDSLMVSGTAQRQDGRSSVSAEVSGAALWFAGDGFLARRVDRSFAVVHVGDVAGLPVLLNGQEVARTDSRGLAVLPDLRPFESNRVDVDIDDLPLSLYVPQTHFDVVPYRRGGADLDVPVWLAAPVRLMLDGERSVPAGARVQRAGGSDPVGRDGQAFIQGLAGDSVLLVTWIGGRCQARLHLPLRTTGQDPGEEATLRCDSVH